MSHLPMSADTISVIKATSSVVAPKAHEITQTFYPILFRDYPVALQYFNKTNQKKGLQSAALGDSVIAFATLIDNLGAFSGTISKINERHCALGITPDLYAAVHASLLKAIVQVLGDDVVTPEVGHAWSEAILALSEMCWTGEESLYQQAEARVGGWRGFREFELVKKTVIGEDTIAFDFQAADGYTGVFEYDAGQYLTVRIDGEITARRHYTVTSTPNDGPTLQCSTRLARGSGEATDGVVSSYMHSDIFSIGTKVHLSAPFGRYSVRGLNLDKENRMVVFVTAGIGATPAIAISKENHVTVKGALHVDSSPEKGQGLANKIDESLARNGSTLKVQTLFGKNRAEVYEAIKEFGAENSGCDVICCGPLGFMQSAAKALEEVGIDTQRIHCEMFGTGNVKT
eukprot:GHVH01011022.1.p1 GENE.GHVH01011022.1~~GHVH01011022.1.p1  ORF type:complete len:401 (+),score=54.82 GHVH01011022.1:36-1238(+)